MTAVFQQDLHVMRLRVAALAHLGAAAVALQNAECCSETSTVQKKLRVAHDLVDEVFCSIKKDLDALTLNLDNDLPSR